MDYPDHLQVHLNQQRLKISRTFDLLDAVKIGRVAADAAKQAEELMPDFSHDTFTLLGLENFEATTDLQKTSAFRKEGKFESDRFRVVADGRGKYWLLKYAIQWNPKAAPRTKLEKLFLIQMNQAEVFASRVASLTDYPMPETKLVLYEGTPCLAYEYFEGATDQSFIYEAPANQSNPEATWTRTMFNILIGATGDSKGQGIITTDNKYYAQDTGVCYKDPTTIKSDAGIASSAAGIVKNLRNWNYRQTFPSTKFLDFDYGPLPDANRADIVAANKNFAKKAAERVPGQAAKIFRDFIGSEKEKKILTEQLKRRGKMLPVIMEMVSSGSS